VTCALGDLAPGAVVTIGLVVEATGPFLPEDIGDDGRIANTASVTSPGSNCPPDGTGGADCRSTADLPIGPTIAIAKTSSLTRIVPGAQVPYELTVTNTGVVPNAAPVVTDVLPDGLTYVSSDDPACTSADGVTVTCTLTTLPVDGVRVIGLVTRAADPFPASGVDPGGTVTNAATVASPGSNCPAASPDGPECTGTVELPLQVRLTIAKTSSAGAIVPGQVVPWSIAVTNTGAATAPAVTVSDPLPAGLTFVSSGTAGCASADGHTVACALGSVAPGATVTIDLVTRAADPFPATDVDASGQVPNTAMVAAPGSNCLPAPAVLGRVGLAAVAVAADDVCSATAALPVRPQVTIAKSADTEQVVPGAEVAWRIVVTNTGPVVAPDAVVSDHLPEGLTFVSSDTPGCAAPDGTTVTCSLGDLAAGSSVTVRLVTRAADPLPAAALDDAGRVPNTAAVTVPGSNCGPAAARGRAAVAPQAGEVCSATATVRVQPTLDVDKTTSAPGVTPGADIPYLLTVTNTGMVTATDVVAVDTLPEGMTFVSSDGACTASADGRVVTCPIGDLAPGETATVGITAHATDPFPADGMVDGQVVNGVTITGTSSNCDGGTPADARCSAEAVLPPMGVPAPPATGGGGALPRTGAEVARAVGLGLAALAAGLGLRAVARRRRRARVA
jgi:uncharacterized repeat protein (TIGR01451 family)